MQPAPELPALHELSFSIKCMFKTVKILTNMSSVNSRIVRIQTAQFHYSTINFLVSKYSIFVLHTSIDSNSAVSNSEMYFLDKNAH